MKVRGELPNVEGDAVRDYKAMHEENLCERANEERTARAEKNEEGKGEKRKREEEKEENQTVTVKRRSE